MKTKMLIAALALAATPALVVPAFADDDDRDDHRGRAGAMMMSRMDANGDSAVSKDEFLSRKTTVFTRMDTNGDGKLSREELGSGYGGPGTAAPEAMRTMHAAKMDRRFRAYDADNDGVVSVDEYTAMPALRFSLMDANGDGSVTPDEMMSQGGMGGMGCDHDGRRGHGGHHGMGDRD